MMGRLSQLFLGATLACTLPAHAQDAAPGQVNPYDLGDKTLYPAPAPVGAVKRLGTVKVNKSLASLVAQDAVAKAESKAVRLELVAVLRSDEIAGQPVPKGMEAVVLVTRWTNLVPRAKIAKSRLEGKSDRSNGAGGLFGGGSTREPMVETDVAYEINTPRRHVFLAADGLAYEAAPAAKALPDALPLDGTFVLKRHGEQKVTRTAFLVPVGSTNLSFRFIDAANGNLSVTAAGDAAAAIAAPKTATAASHIAGGDLTANGVRYQNSYLGQKAPEGWRYARVALLGRGLGGAQSSILQFEPMTTAWLEGDEGRIFTGLPPEDGGHMVTFTPEVYQARELAFLVPASATRFRLGIRGHQASVTLPATAEAPAPLTPAANAQADGKTLTLSVYGHRWEKDALVLDLAIRSGMAAKGIDLTLKEQFAVTAGGKALKPDLALTGVLSKRPPEPATVPPMAAMRFELAFKVADDAVPDQLVYHGFEAELSFDLKGLPIVGTKGQATPGGTTAFPVFKPGKAEGPEAAETGASQKPATPAKPKASVEQPPIALPAYDPASVSAEQEPNNTVKDAGALGPNHMVRGTLAPGDIDIFYLDIADGEKMQKWLFEVEGAGVGGEIAYIDASGFPQVQRRPKQGAPSVWLENLFLAPGRHWFSVAAGAKGGDYVLRLIPLGALAPGDEQEPNDDASRAQPLEFGTVRHGLIAIESDIDRYAFTLDARSHIRLTMTPPADLKLDLRIQGNGSGIDLTGDTLGGPGKPVVYEAMLAPGEYQLQVSSVWRGASRLPYSLALELLDPFVLPGDLEPNNTAGSASPLVNGMTVDSMVGDFGDMDWYRLPVLKAQTKLELTLDSQGRKAYAAMQRLDSARSETIALAPDPKRRTPDGDVYQAMLEPGQTYALSIGGQTKYRMTAHFAPEPEQAAQPEDGGALGLALTGDAPVFSAYRDSVQTAEVKLHLSAGDADLSGVKLQGTVSQSGWSVVAPDAPISLKKGESKDVPVTLVASADRRDGVPATLFLRAQDASGMGKTLAVPVASRCEALPLGEAPYEPVPVPLRGGLNLAATALGAQPTPKNATLAQLFDGLVPDGGEWTATTGQLPVDITIELAGDGSVPVTGLAIVPQVSYGNQDQLDVFSASVSDDGTTFTEVFHGHLSAVSEEQYFVFDHPVAAKFVRIRLEPKDSRSAYGRLSLAEIKVIADPAGHPFGATPVNLADPKWGGHIVRALPQAGRYAILAAMLTEEEDGTVLDYTKGDVAALDWVVGFRDNRAAQITGVDWREPAKPLPQGVRSVGHVEIAVSLNSPLGPWRTLGEWDVPTDPGQSKAIAFKAPVWARFVRFQRAGESNDSHGWRLPETLRILERPANATYKSAAGEWGLYRQQAIYEATTGDWGLTGATDKDIAGDTAATAYALTPGTPVTESVSIGKDRDIYSLKLPADMNRISLAFRGPGASRIAVTIRDEAGHSLPIADSPENDGTRRVTANASGGKTYFVTVEEPPRSIMITWDNSSSVSKFHPAMYRALQRFFDDVQPGREWVNLMPFQDRGAQPLLPDWSDDAQALRKALNGYGRNDGSSNAENTLASALTTLDHRSGNRAIVVLTDAASDGFMRSRDLWAGFSKLKPAVFPLDLHLAAREVAHSQDLMQDWASVNGGRYTTFRTLADLDRSFARAACLMRRQVTYTLTASYGHIEPGMLKLAWVKGKAAAGATVELIVDASGSMRSRKALIDGKLKIDVAKDVLREVIAKFPDQIDVGLRVYGHRVREGQAGDCQDSELVLPVGALDRAALLGKVEAVKALGTTPIAYSLQQAGQDLAGKSGRKLIVLVTDGEEECKGNPAETIRTLRDRGLDVRLDIAGFALPDEKTKAAMRKAATAGGGDFFDAASRQSLLSALDGSLAAPFEVTDAEGQVMARGQVGGAAFKLAPGPYVVSVHGARTDASFAVTIQPGGQHTLTLEASGQAITRADEKPAAKGK